MLDRMKTLIAPDEASDDILQETLVAAEGIVLNRMYPFGYEDGAVVPARYESTMLQIAVELFSRRGAEGQTQHQENGTQRTWETGDVSPHLLKRIHPMCGSVRRNA